MSTEHIEALVATVKTGRSPTGWQADMALLEVGAIEAALRVVFTDEGARVGAKEYKAAKELLERMARRRR